MPYSVPRMYFKRTVTFITVECSKKYITCHNSGNCSFEMAKKGKKAVVNPHKRLLSNRAPKKGDCIEYQWDDKGVEYKKDLVERGGKNTMTVKWDEEGLQNTVDVKGKNGWWFFEAGNAKRGGEPGSRRSRR